MICYSLTRKREDTMMNDKETKKLLEEYNNQNYTIDLEEDSAEWWSCDCGCCDCGGLDCPCCCGC